MAASRLALALCAVAFAASGRTVPAQTALAAASAPAFEAVSIRQNLAGPPVMFIRVSPSGIVTGSNVNVQMLLRYGYGVLDFRIFDLPEWAQREHFDIAARGPAEAPTQLTRAMVRSLLAERFGAVVRTDWRELEVDTLTRAGAELGPQLRPSATPCVPQPGTSTCGIQPAFGNIRGTGATLGAFVDNLAMFTRRHVVDATGLHGPHDFTLTYTPDDLSLEPSLRERFPTVDPDGPALATALREQLGLRLTRGRAQVEVVVVEKLIRPELDGDAVR
jgi:uncharacterized protein (TIGR03435 family)